MRLFRKYFMAFVALGFLGYFAWWMLLRSDWLRDKIRERAIVEIEKATGGKASIGTFRFDPELLGATFDDFTLRGTEGPQSAPLFTAARIDAGFRILSFIKKDVDLRRLVITGPKINIILDSQGRTNLPSPAGPRRAGRTPFATILALAIEEFAITNGEFNYADKRTPFAIAARNLETKLVLDGPVYKGAVASKDVLLDMPGMPRLPVDLRGDVVVREGAVDLPKFEVASVASRIEGAGRVHYADSVGGEFDIKVQSDLSESARLFHFSAGRGTVLSAGKFQWLGGPKFQYDGDLRAPALDIAAKGVRIRPVRVAGRLKADLDTLTLTDLRADSPEGQFQGRAALPKYKRVEVDGDIADFSLANIEARAGKSLGFSGRVSGPVHMEAAFGGAIDANGDLAITPAEGATPIEGRLRANYRGATGDISFGESLLITPSSRVEFTGTLNQTLRVKANLTSLADLRALGVEEPLPVSLDSGTVEFAGTVSGTAREPLAAGQLRATNVVYEKSKLDSISAALIASPSKLTLTRVTAAQGAATVSGTATITLAEWRAGKASTIDARLDARAINLATVREQLGIEERVDGLVNATIRLNGTAGEPTGEIDGDWFRPAFRGETIDRLRFKAAHDGSRINVSEFEATRGAAKLSGSGTYVPNGPASVDFALNGLDLATVPQVQSIRSGVRAAVQATGKVTAQLVGKEWQVRFADARGSLSNLVIDGEALGNLRLNATTRANDLTVAIDGTLAGAAIKGTSAWKLETGYPGSARMEFGQLPFRVFQTLRPAKVAAEEWPFTGGFRGSVDFRGPLLEVDKWRVAVALSELFARTTRGNNVAGFELRNDGPVVFSAEGRTIQIRGARFVGQDTNLSVGGTFSLAEKRPWDLRVNGRVNLAGLRAYSQDFVATGVATMQTSIRGELASPQVFGSLELKDATLNVDGVPNGLDKVTGRVLFDRRRATIQDKLTAQSGGGELSLAGFFDFASAETFYRLQAQASRVRIRYPEGVSTVGDANLTLTGAATRSLLAGSITILRSGFTPRIDLGGLLAESSRAQSAPSEPNRFLANMQLDVKIRTAPDSQFTTSLTNDLQAEANLQVRGVGSRPIVLGRVAISQGDVNFFGNKYTIKRGDVAFYNPATIEPTLDMDLETRVRGVNVTVNFSGPVKKLNVSYRSDPPLQPSEIIALLTVGRSPTSATVGTSQSSASGSFLESGGNSLLGSAISAPLSSQLQRFFGVSRIKIDPTISGLDSTPQARVTVEQQVSKDVTMTFVTNLNRSQQQVVRLEWNMSREWSLIALRDENGAFGLDFQVRKQVK